MAILYLIYWLTILAKEIYDMLLSKDTHTLNSANSDKMKFMSIIMYIPLIELL